MPLMGSSVERFFLDTAKEGINEPEDKGNRNYPN